MIHNQCGTELPTDVGAVVTHLAGCPHGTPELSAWCRHIVSAVSRAADIETPAVSPEVADETPLVSRDTARTGVVSTAPDIEELVLLRDGGASLRYLANLAGVAPETVRRRIKRHRAGQDGA